MRLAGGFIVRIVMMTRTSCALTLSLILLSACLVVPRTATGPSSGAPPTENEASQEPGNSSSPAMGSQPDRAAAPAAPQTASVTIRSACSRTAKVFYGEKPGYSSGTTSSVSSNSVSSKTFRAGDQMWVLDDSGKPLGNVTISGSTRQVEISSSCTGISAR